MVELFSIIASVKVFKGMEQDIIGHLTTVPHMQLAEILTHDSRYKCRNSEHWSTNPSAPICKAETTRMTSGMPKMLTFYQWFIMRIFDELWWPWSNLSELFTKGAFQTSLKYV